MDYERLAQIANTNSALNSGRVFTAETVKQFVEDSLLAVDFMDKGKLYGLITVTADGELGFILDPAYAKTAYAPMCATLEGFHIPLYCTVQLNNRALLRVLQEHGFEVSGSNDTHIELRRG